MFRLFSCYLAREIGNTIVEYMQFPPKKYGQAEIGDSTSKGLSKEISIQTLVCFLIELDSSFVISVVS